MPGRTDQGVPWTQQFLIGKEVPLFKATPWVLLPSFTYKQISCPQERRCRAPPRVKRCSGPRHGSRPKGSGGLCRGLQVHSSSPWKFSAPPVQALSEDKADLKACPLAPCSILP